MQTTSNFSAVRLGASALLIASFAFASPQALASEGTPNWQPQSSERLIKLPARYMGKSLDQSFLDSSLGQALNEAEQDIGAKAGTLQELQSATTQANGEMRTEMRHQLLSEKRAYLELMTSRNNIRREQVATKLRVMEDAMSKLSATEGASTPAKQDLLANQNSAQQRFAASQSQVDLNVFESTSTMESKYGTKYAENMGAIEQLMGRITTHAMTQTTGTNGEALTKEQYLRQMVVDAQAELSLIDQEDTILGYMAKLVALDALALSEEVMDAEMANVNPNQVQGLSPSQAVSFFINN